jgi:hypothetical protein
MQHLDEGTIHSWLDGELSGDEVARVEAHVKECPECAAAVAEARGFIAASSRILTALDNAPRGVIPAVAPIRRRNWAMWRAAAAVLVVAGGSLVVMRNIGRESQVTGPAYEATAANAAMPLAVDSGEGIRTTPQPAPPVKIQGSPSRRTTVGSSQPNVRSRDTSAATLAAADAVSATSQAAAPSPQATDRSEGRDGFRANVPPRDMAAVAGQVGGVATEKLSIPSLARAPAAPPPVVPTAQPLGMIRIRGASSLTAAIDSAPLKVVGTPRRIGAKVTLYEVAPGDTVTLTEPDLRLEAVVVTGIATAEPMAKQSARRAAATEQREAGGSAAVDSQRAANAKARARAPFPAPVTAVEIADGVTTINWTDATTGGQLKLSGRMSEARLQQIKIRIERERAAAAKKTP